MLRGEKKVTLAIMRTIHLKLFEVQNQTGQGLCIFIGRTC